MTTDDATKVLKGNDRIALKKLCSMVDDSVSIVARVTLQSECLEFFDMVTSTLLRRSSNNNMTVVSTQLLQDTCAILALRTTGKHASTVAAFVDQCNSLTAILEHVNEAMQGTLSTQAAQKTFENWLAWAEKFTKIGKTVVATGPESEAKDCKQLEAGIHQSLEKLTAQLQALLCGKVCSEATELVAKCVIFAKDKLFVNVEKKVPFQPEELDGFWRDVESCNRLTTVMKESGATIRAGLKVVDMLVKSHCVFSTAKLLRAGDDDTSEVPETELAAVGEVREWFAGMDACKQRQCFEKMFECLDAQLGKAEWAQDSGCKAFVQQCEVLRTETGATIDKYFELFGNDIKQDALDVAMPVLVIPQECLVCENLEAFVTSCSDIVFSMSQDKDFSNRVVETSTCLESLKKKIDTAAKHLRVQPAELYSDVGKVHAQWKECLCWLPLSAIKLKLTQTQAQI